MAEQDLYSIIPYTPDMADEWNRFVGSSRNGTFLHRRGYMDYHADRFEDRSLVVLRDGKPMALLPAAVKGDDVCSHPGLTYGGLLVGNAATSVKVLDMFRLITGHYRKEGFRNLVYKPVPHIYHTIPAEEDLYAVWRLGGSLLSRRLSSVIEMDDRLKFRKDRRAGARKALAAGITTAESTDYAPFWRVLEDNLASRYNAKPVHSLAEISMLAARFPENIRLFTASLGGKTVGGTVLFITKGVVHAQYISATPEGKSKGAVDLLFDILINQTFSDCRWFDFGTSNEDDGNVLNETLISQKQGFGARGVCYDTYIIPLS